MRTKIIFLIAVIFLAIATTSPAQRRIKRRGKAEIIGRINFENHKIDNNYSPFDLQSDFGTMLSLGTFFPSARVKIVDTKSEHGKVIRVKYPKGSLRSMASGASWEWKNFGKHEDLYLSFWVKFAPDFVFRAGGKLHGLCGGKCNTGGDKPNGHDGWSSRIHWGPGNTLKNYVYHKDQPGKYGQVLFWTHRPKTVTLKKGKFDKKIVEKNRVKIKPGVWYHVATRVKVNHIGNSDGVVQSWLNGELVLDVRGLEFRDKTCKKNDLLIDTMYFSTFFGGNSEKYKPVKDEYIFFDDFVLSKKLYVPEIFVHR
ncbi:MAG: hypothetical protein GXO74_05145 [Calditrichaeota bacterium]|nr:hypothetical protein [Calditrichota bacterium]